MMIIALNGKILENSKPAGPEYFTYNLFKKIISLDRENRYLVYCQDNKKPWLQELAEIGNNITLVPIKNTVSWTQLGVARQLLKDKPNIYFTTEHTIPFISNRNTKMVAMIHGLEYKTNNELKKSSIKYLIHPLILKWVCYRSSIIIVPSEYTKESLVKNKLISDLSKINVISEGVGEEYNSGYPKELINEVLKRLGINNQYILFVSTIQPRKNLEGLLTAFSNILLREEFNNIDLVLVGKQGWNSQHIMDFIKKPQLNKRVKYLGWVEKKDLPLIFSGAMGFVNFSFEEGFGLPLLESLKSGVPSAVSNINAYKEIAGDAVIYADPSNINSIESALLTLISNSKTGKDIEKVNKGLDIANRYTWEATAVKVMALFKKLL